MKIVGAQVLGPDFRFHDYTVEIQGDTITALTEAASQETSCDVVSYQGLKLIPGLIDTHMHGYYGKQCSSKDPEDLAVISYRLELEGVTGYAATISTGRKSVNRYPFLPPCGGKGRGFSAACDPHGRSVYESCEEGSHERRIYAAAV